MAATTGTDYPGHLDDQENSMAEVGVAEAKAHA